MVFCTECGTENVDDSKFCYNCGKEINKDKIIKKVNSKPNEVSNEEIRKYIIENRKYKSPWAAALSNLLIAGLGLAYVKEYPKAIVGFIIVFAAGYLGGLIIGFLALILIMAWSADEARKYNRRIDGNY